MSGLKRGMGGRYANAWGCQMEDEGTGRPELSSPMKVGELIARLQKVDPNFLIVVGADSQCLIVVNPRPGFCYPADLEEEDVVPHFTEPDLNFLRQLHIK